MEDKSQEVPSMWTMAPQQFWTIAYIVLGIFLVVMFLILLGCWALLSGRVGADSGPALAAVAGLVGAIAGYAASSVQTVLSTIYGGSMGQHGTKPSDPKSAEPIASP